jgi:mRNA-degrading endonuclease toxin of MazEF toxin-antitoxin module
VYVLMTDPQGRNPKNRPAVVVTSTDQIRADGLVRVAAITSQVGVASAEVTVELPWHRDGHPRTKLRRPSEVVCTWSELFPADQLTDAGGFVSADRMARVLQIVAALDAAQTPQAATDPPAAG